jgi:GAF domain-containing protein
VIGVIGLAYLDAERKFGAQEIEALERFAQLAAIALDNAQLYESTQSVLQQTRRIAEREKAIAEITDRLYAAPDIKWVLQTAAEELQRTTGSKRAIVRLNLQENGKTNGTE